MIILAGGRQSGKTTSCIKWMLEQPGQRHLLVANEERRRDVVRQLQQCLPQFQDWQAYVSVPRNLSEMSRGRNLVWGSELGIDDLELVLQVIFTPRVELATVNATEIPIGRR